MPLLFSTNRRGGKEAVEAEASALKEVLGAVRVVVQEEVPFRPDGPVRAEALAGRQVHEALEALTLATAAAKVGITVAGPSSNMANAREATIASSNTVKTEVGDLDLLALPTPKEKVSSNERNLIPQANCASISHAEVVSLVIGALMYTPTPMPLRALKRGRRATTNRRETRANHGAPHGALVVVEARGVQRSQTRLEALKPRTIAVVPEVNAAPVPQR